jgi:SP family general alpha glucoside:H+ symporter-like MFS transporter
MLSHDDMEAKGHPVQVENAYGSDTDEKSNAAHMKADAIEAENVELNMGVLEAVRRYPMATLWAFIFSCTIVSGMPAMTPSASPPNE